MEENTTTNEYKTKKVIFRAYQYSLVYLRDN